MCLSHIRIDIHMCSHSRNLKKMRVREKGLYCFAWHFDYSEKAPEQAVPSVTVLHQHGCKHLSAILSTDLI